MAVVPSAFRASRTAHWASTVGMTPTGSDLKSTRPDGDRGCTDRPSQPVDTPGRRRSAKSAAFELTPTHRRIRGDFAEGSRLERGESVKGWWRTDHLPKRGDDGTTSCFAGLRIRLRRKS